MPFTIVRQDITKMNVDAIVNAANTALQMGGGVCGAIFSAAGASELQAACDKKAPIETGSAAITPGFRLPARYVIHAAGPVYHAWDKEQSRRLLRSAYLESLKLAKSYDCGSIAFPLISSGIYGYPKAEALQVASQAIQDFLQEQEMDVYLAVFDKSAFVISEKLVGEVESYIDEHYVNAHRRDRRQLLEAEYAAMKAAPSPDDLSAPIMAPSMTAPSSNDLAKPGSAASLDGLAEHLNVPSLDDRAAHSDKPSLDDLTARLDKPSLDDLVAHLDEPFSHALFQLIDAKGKTDVEVYKRANIDRRLFSKIRSVHGYTPKKPTILALAVALELSLPETDKLLERAGYALSHASKFDVIVEYFIVNGKYNIFDINEVLFQYDQPLLGA